MFHVNNFDKGIKLKRIESGISAIDWLTCKLIGDSVNQLIIHSS